MILKISCVEPAPHRAHTRKQADPLYGIGVPDHAQMGDRTDFAALASVMFAAVREGPSCSLVFTFSFRFDDEGF